MYARFRAENRSTDHFLGAHELSIRDHFEMQRVCQRHVDNAVSKTINLPKHTDADELSDLYMEFFPELKAYEPGAIEARWAEFWIKERLFSVKTPPPGESRPVFTLLLPPPNVRFA